MEFVKIVVCIPILQVPPTSVPGEFKLRVEGLYNSLYGGSAFVNETKLTFSQRSMTIFIQTDKPIYIQGETGMYYFSTTNLQVNFTLQVNF